MVSARNILRLVASIALVSSTSAFTGRGPSLFADHGYHNLLTPHIIATVDALGTTPCVPSCPLTDFRVALPIDLFPNGQQCCSTVQISCMHPIYYVLSGVEYAHLDCTDEGKNIQATFTDLCESCAGSFNISLSRDAFAELAPLETEFLYPVVWNL